MPEISVIVPVYKVEPYLRRCVDSILNQTFTDFELILVDDGSPDNCPAICDEYAALDPRVRVIHQENGGLSAARNAGIEIAQGQYLLFCDSDDYVSNMWCEVLYSAIKLTPKSFVVCNMYRVSNGENVLIGGRGVTDVDLKYFDIYKLGLSAYAVNKIYCRELLRRNSLRFDETCNYAEDVAFNVSYFEHCDGCVYIEEPLYYYIYNVESIMNRYNEKLLTLHIPLFWCRLRVLDETEIEDYCDIWLYQFLILLDNVFDTRNSDSTIKKIRYNHKAITTPEFQFCLHHASGKNENPWVIRILKTKNYYLYWLFDRLVKLKRKLRGEKK